jgi:lipopolysaccharide transport system ATP-binding protein
MNVIEIEHLDKVFRIPHVKQDTLFAALTGLFKPASYELFHALHDINFCIEEGEMFGIIGENGSGKSTLLKIISNIMRPTSGKVHVRKMVTPFLELGVGFQPDFSAVENISMYGTIMGLSNREIQDKIEMIIDFASLHRFKDTKLKFFSSGMQVRLAFSIAIQTNPEILLLDEVLAVGDMDFQKKCLDKLDQFKKEGATIVFVSHNLEAVKKHCHRALLISHGEQIVLGDTDEVVTRYERQAD